MDKEVSTESEKKKEKMRTRGESNGGGAPPLKSPFVTLGFQFPGKNQPPPPSTKLVLKYIELR